MNDQNGNNPTLDGVSRRSFLGVGSTAIAGLTAHAQEREDFLRKAGNHRRVSRPTLGRTGAGRRF
jgi:hypothetical protein